MNYMKYSTFNTNRKYQEINRKYAHCRAENLDSKRNGGIEISNYCEEKKFQEICSIYQASKIYFVILNLYEITFCWKNIRRAVKKNVHFYDYLLNVGPKVTT